MSASDILTVPTLGASDILTVPTFGGLSLQLACYQAGPAAGHVHGELLAPAPDAPGRLQHRVAFLSGGRPVLDVYVEPRLGKHLPAAVWIGGTSIDVDDAAAETVRAWLDSRGAARRPAVRTDCAAAQPATAGAPA